jgi:hypothetical protein
VFDARGVCGALADRVQRPGTDAVEASSLATSVDERVARTGRVTHSDREQPAGGYPR